MPSDHRTDRAATSTTDHVPSGSTELRPRRARTTSTTSRAAPPSSDHIDHGPCRPRPERLCRAPTTSTTRPRRNDDRREERRYDNRDHRHDDRSESSRTGRLHHRRSDLYPKIRISSYARGLRRSLLDMCSGNASTTLRPRLGDFVARSSTYARGLPRPLFDHGSGTLRLDYMRLATRIQLGYFFSLRPCYKAHTSPSSKLGTLSVRCTCRCISYRLYDD